MPTLPPIFLDSGWTCRYGNDSADAIPVPSLAGWSFDANHSDNRIARVERSFSLEPTDDCINYVLDVDSAPTDTKIYVNGEQIGEYRCDDQPFELDITYNVALGENALAFVVGGEAAGRFEGVRLQPVSCQ